MHGISEQEWIDYLNEALSGGERDRDRLGAHLSACAECRELHGRIVFTVESLRGAGAEVRGAFPLDEEQLHASLVRVLARILDRYNGGAVRK